MTSPYPPHRPVEVAVARAADLEAVARGVPSLVLMEHAGRGLASLAADLFTAQARRRGDAIVVVCGPGNNGGDGYAAARFLSSWGYKVRVLRSRGVRPRTADARVEAALAGAELPLLDVAPSAFPDLRTVGLFDAAVIVDALYGVGVTRELQGQDLAWVAAMNAATALRLCADVPSGLDADEGVARPTAVRAHVTAAMGLVKRGCTLRDGPAYCGRVVELDIGLPRDVHAPHLADPPPDGAGEALRPYVARTSADVDADPPEPIE